MSINHFEFKPEDFKEVLPKNIQSDEILKNIAAHANIKYLNHVYEQPRLYGILKRGHYMGFEAHLGEYDNVMGYLCEIRGIGGEHVY